jgi:hypothetical protein
MGAGDFLVVNDTGHVVTNFSLTLISNFNASTPSAGPCHGAQTGHECVNFTIHGGAANYFATVILQGPTWDSCTQGTTVGSTCVGAPGGAAGNFAQNTVTYTWQAGTDAGVPVGAKFDLNFASWDNDVQSVSTPEPSSLFLLLPALVGFGLFVKSRHVAKIRNRA